MTARSARPIGIILALLLALAACAPAATPTPTLPPPAPPATAEPTASPTPPPTATAAPPPAPTAVPTLPPTATAAPTATPAPTETPAPTATVEVATPREPYPYQVEVGEDGVKYAGELDFSAQDTDGNMKANYRVSVAAIERINEAIQGGSVVKIGLAPGALDGFVDSLMKDRESSPAIKRFVGPGKAPIELRSVTGEELLTIKGTPIWTSDGVMYGMGVDIGTGRLTVYRDIETGIGAEMKGMSGTEADIFSQINDELQGLGVKVDSFWTYMAIGGVLKPLQHYLYINSGSGTHSPSLIYDSICRSTAPKCKNVVVEVAGQ